MRPPPESLEPAARSRENESSEAQSGSICDAVHGIENPVTSVETPRLWVMQATVDGVLTRISHRTMAKSRFSWDN
jgi:hypothetical protein